MGEYKGENPIMNVNEVLDILKRVLLIADGCYAHCVHSYMDKGRPTCDMEAVCINHSKYEIDYDVLRQDYGMEEE